MYFCGLSWVDSCIVITFYKDSLSLCYPQTKYTGTLSVFVCEQLKKFKATLFEQ